MTPVLLPDVPARALRRLLVAGLTLAAVSAPASAQSADSAEVVRVAQALLTAISTKDVAAARAVLMPGAQFVSVRNPASAAMAARTESDSGFYASLSTEKRTFAERMWQPTVQLHGSLAVVHAPYDFHVGGTFSHCGVDTFTLVKHRGAWRIATVAYTVQPTGCAPSPLGPPAG